MPTITVRRGKGWMDKFRKYRILIDGVEVGRIKQGVELTCEVAEGPHVVEARIDWCSAEPLAVDVGSEDVVVRVKNSVTVTDLAFARYRVQSNQTGYLTLEWER